MSAALPTKHLLRLQITDHSAMGGMFVCLSTSKMLLIPPWNSLYTSPKTKGKQKYFCGVYSRHFLHSQLKKGVVDPRPCDGWGLWRPGPEQGSKANTQYPRPPFTARNNHHNQSNHLPLSNYIHTHHLWFGQTGGSVPGWASKARLNSHEVTSLHYDSFISNIRCQEKLIQLFQNATM